ncbi:MAG: Clp protease ClpP [Chloroflexi bacterium]|nr:Clp protease ClpP [Chloroflexota bacterium]
MKNKLPIRCFDGNAKPYEPFWAFRNADQTESGEVEIELYGPISEFSWWGDEITPKMFKDQLYANGKGAAITVRLNSPGGDVIAASVMSAVLKDYPGKVTIKIDGMAASAAVMVALAGDVVKIQASAYMMIHDPTVGLMGWFKVDELKNLIDELKVIKNGIVEGYTAKTKMEVEKLSKLMSDETWMTASEAVAYGFADEVITVASKNTASNKKVNYVNVLQPYVNVPRALLEESSPAQPDAVNKERAQQSKKLAAHAKLYLTKE